MSGFLTHKDKTQLSKWMSRDSQFCLLYKLSRDGVPPQRFHELCDNKGPTVTILYNTDNNVYGGYLSDSWGNTYVPDNWGSTGSWCTDQRAFLFKLYSAGNWKPKKFPYICGETHYQASICGPCFFSLRTFYSNKEDKISRKNYYQLSTDSFFDGKRFDMKGETAQSVANGHNNVTDLEVYLVKDKELIVPWRETPEWNSQTLQELKDFVAKYEPLEEINIQEVNILLLGQVGAGKSSFINTINSIFKDELSCRACIGSEKHSITKKFEKFRIRDHSTKKYLRFRICDTRGVDERMSIDSEELSFILDGNLPNHYKKYPT
ncbi:interferon-induced protein 44-like [Magallana gigas]|uniref:interferon-induced protein 44-like n=1 Tax=Magallana gigas TaxID=29159 RepID=UPI003342AC40